MSLRVWEHCIWIYFHFIVASAKLLKCFLHLDIANNKQESMSGSWCMWFYGLCARVWVYIPHCVLCTVYCVHVILFEKMKLKTGWAILLRAIKIDIGIVFLFISVCVFYCFMYSIINCNSKRFRAYISNLHRFRSERMIATGTKIDS